MQLEKKSRYLIRQRRELAELFGFETRNKYEILDENKNVIGYCAEQQKGFLGFIMRQFLGHWRSFELHFFNSNRQFVFKSQHPFRFFFQEFSLVDSHNKTIGHIRQRFGLFTKKFDAFDENNRLILEMRSGFLSFWTFPMKNVQGQTQSTIQKKWSGLFSEIFSDRDNFMIEVHNPNLDQKHHYLFLAAGVFIDLQYFEKKAD